MKEEQDIIKNRVEKLENLIVNNNKILSSLMDCQISLETHLQEIIKSSCSNIIAIKGATKIDFIPINEIIYCIADLAYTEIVTINNNKVLATKSINEFEQRFFGFNFFRISKSVLINTKYIHSYNKKNGQLLMKNNELLDVARRRKSQFLSAVLP
jgi:two-component system LytT family response regulator